MIRSFIQQICACLVRWTKCVEMRRVTVYLIPFTMCHLRFYLHACANVLQFTVLSWTKLVLLLSMHRSKHSWLIINQLKLTRCVCIASCIVVGLHLRTAQWLHDTKLDMCANLVRNPFGYSETSNHYFVVSYPISCNLIQQTFSTAASKFNCVMWVVVLLPRMLHFPVYWWSALSKN